MYGRSPDAFSSKNAEGNERRRAGFERGVQFVERAFLFVRGTLSAIYNYFLYAILFFADFCVGFLLVFTEI